MTDAGGIPLAALTSAANRNEVTMLLPLLAAVIKEIVEQRLARALTEEDAHHCQGAPEKERRADRGGRGR